MSSNRCKRQISLRANNRDDRFVTGQTGPKATSFSKSEKPPLTVHRNMAPSPVAKDWS